MRRLLLMLALVGCGGEVPGSDAGPPPPGNYTATWECIGGYCDPHGIEDMTDCGLNGPTSTGFGCNGGANAFAGAGEWITTTCLNVLEGGVAIGTPTPWGGVEEFHVCFDEDPAAVVIFWTNWPGGGRRYGAWAMHLGGGSE